MRGDNVSQCRFVLIQNAHLDLKFSWLMIIGSNYVKSAPCWPCRIWHDDDKTTMMMMSHHHTHNNTPHQKQTHTHKHTHTPQTNGTKQQHVSFWHFLVGIHQVTHHTADSSSYLTTCKLTYVYRFLVPNLLSKSKRKKNWSLVNRFHLHVTNNAFGRPLETIVCSATMPIQKFILRTTTFRFSGYETSASRQWTSKAAWPSVGSCFYPLG